MNRSKRLLAAVALAACLPLVPRVPAGGVGFGFAGAVMARAFVGLV